MCLTMTLIYQRPSVVVVVWTRYLQLSPMAAAVQTVIFIIHYPLSISQSRLITFDYDVFTGLDPDVSPDEQEEKARLISQVLELQNTLDGESSLIEHFSLIGNERYLESIEFTDLSQRVDSVKEENLKLRSENQVLGQYIENLMSASSVFQSTSPKSKKK